MDDHGREPGTAEPTDDSTPGPVTTELPPPEPAAPARRPLRRSASDKVIAGVAGGLAENFGVSSLAVRTLFGLAFVVVHAHDDGRAPPRVPSGMTPERP